jgi:spore maturation protein CgeB
VKIHYTATVWHGGYYRFFGGALRSLGHEVVFFDDGGTKSQKSFERIATRIPRMQYWAEDKFRQAVSRRWLRSVYRENPDLIILEHAPNILSEAVRDARKLKKPIFYWVDSPAAGAQAKDMLASLAYADKVFTIDRSKAWTTILYERDDIGFLPLAGDPEAFYPIPSFKKEYDVVFVGSLPPQNGDGYLRAKILASIPERYRVAVCGTGIEYWHKHFPELRGRVARQGRLSAESLNEFYAKSKLFLNIHSTWHFTSSSARTFEVALAGLFQLVDHRADHDELFPRDLLITFRSAKEIASLLDRWLAPSADQKRQEIAEKTRAYVHSHHTWRHRAEKMLQSFPGAS